LTVLCRHEPHIALTDGSESGMEALEAVACCASNLLVSGGFFAVEVRPICQHGVLCTALCHSLQHNSRV
jgi:hypothetical protein